MTWFNNCVGRFVSRLYSRLSSQLPFFCSQQTDTAHCCPLRESPLTRDSKQIRRLRRLARRIHYKL